MKRRLLNLLTDCREKRWVFLLLSSTRAVRAMACSNHYFPGPHTWRAQSPAVPSPPPSSHVFTLQLCSRNGYSVVRNFCGIKFPPVLESYIQTHPQPRPQGFSLKKFFEGKALGTRLTHPICFWLINVRKSFMTHLSTTVQDIFNSIRDCLHWGGGP